MTKLPGTADQNGFTIVEVVIACAIFPIIVIGLANGFNAIRATYLATRELNEMYAVLGACPEIDRALEYDSVSNSNNCYPNNSFLSENAGGKITTYSPILTVTDTASLPSSDPLKAVPGSKVINIKVGYQKRPGPPLELRMLITRNGIGQL